MSRFFFFLVKKKVGRIMIGLDGFCSKQLVYIYTVYKKYHSINKFVCYTIEYYLQYVMHRCNFMHACKE